MSRAAEGWELVQVFQDRALSGASLLRPGYQALLEAGRNGGFTVLVAEALDLQARDAASRSGLDREMVQVERKLDGLIEAVADGLRAPGLQAKLDVLENRRAELTRLLAEAVSPAPRLHPNLAEVYRAKVSALAEALGIAAMVRLGLPLVDKI